MDPGTLLERHHLRKTGFRKEVLQIFFAHRGQALSHSDIETELDEADRITLYRTLKSFEEKGLIHHANDGSGTNKYALCNDSCSHDIHHDQHAHFHCTKCGTTMCMYNSLTDLKYKTPSGFVVESAEVVLRGLCSQCN